MLASLIAERYSKALLRSARAEKAVAEVGAQAEVLRLGLTGSAVAAAFLGDPTVEPQEKLRVLTSVLGQDAHPVFRAFLVAALDYKRERFLPGILAAFKRLRDEDEGRVEATFATARPLGPKELGLLQGNLSERLGRTVVLLPVTDRSLLGGAVLKIGDTVFDGSVRGGLERLGRLLKEGSKPRPSKKADPFRAAKPAAGAKKAAPRTADKSKKKAVATPNRAAKKKTKAPGVTQKTPATKKAAKKSRP